MTKKEIINKLVTECGVEDNGLMKKTAKELEEMLKSSKKKDDIDKTEKVDVQEIESESLFEGVIKEDSNTLEETLNGDEEEVISEVQLNIYETIVRRFDTSKHVVIENLGAGDVYIGESKEDLICEDNKLKPNDNVKMGNVNVLYMTSASRPVIRITYASHCL
mgnify:FL=1